MFRRQAADEHAADALLIALDNDRDMYRLKRNVASQLLKKVERGLYSPSRAIDAWMYVVDSAAKMYIVEFDSERDDWPNWPRIFSPTTRQLVAEELAARWEANVKAGRPEEV